MKLCTSCNTNKPLSEFYWTKDSRYSAGGHYQAICKECRRVYRRRYHHGGDRQHVTKQWMEQNKEKLREMKLSSRYKLTIVEYEALLTKQGGCCAICKTVHAQAGGQRMQVDHDHVTKAVRGLLCRKCNLLLGNAGDNVDVLLSAVEYLKSNSTVGL